MVIEQRLKPLSCLAKVVVDVLFPPLELVGFPTAGWDYACAAISRLCVNACIWLIQCPCHSGDSITTTEFRKVGMARLQIKDLDSHLSQRDQVTKYDGKNNNELVVKSKSSPGLVDIYIYIYFFFFKADNSRSCDKKKKKITGKVSAQNIGECDWGIMQKDLGQFNRTWISQEGLIWWNHLYRGVCVWKTC